ncbi:MAG: trypsin-like peptidase domain-containing protein [Planctomycetes bacterium]|nr:trypsin-like peptidase domain-containing protein [Planctomycetota bacterium]
MTHPLIDGFRDHIAKFIVHIEATWDESGETKTMHATGFIAAPASHESYSEELCVVITARHVVADLPTHEVRWKLTRYAEPGQQNATFEFKLPGLMPSFSKIPGVIRTFKPNYDAAAIVIPLVAGVTPPFLEVEKELFPPVIAPGNAVRSGTEIAWAGYPFLITQFLKRPQLCVYRGMVSAAVLDIDPGMYIVDGHAAQGVSGGPVWHSDDKSHRIIGVVSSYLLHGGEMPGLCHFTPVNQLTKFLSDGIQLDEESEDK